MTTQDASIKTTDVKASRTSRFFHGVWLGYTYQAIVMAVGVWLTPFLLKHIGQRDYGLWLVGTQLLMYLGLLDVGILTILPREAASAVGRTSEADRPQQLSLLFGHMIRLILFQMPLVILGVVGAWVFLPSDWASFRGPIAVSMAAFVVAFPLQIFQSFLPGLQDFKFLGQAQIVVWFGSTIATITLVLAGFGLFALAIGWSITQIGTVAVAMFRFRIAFPDILPRKLPPLDGRLLLSYVGRGLWISLAQVASALINGADVLIIGKLFGPLAVVPYACTGKVVIVLANQPNLLMAVAQPGLTELKSGSSPERVLQAITALTQALLGVSGLIGCTVLAVNAGFVSWWVGPKQYGGGLLTALFILNMLLRHWNTTLTYSVFCFGHERRLCFTTLLDGLVTAGMALLLASKLGPIGAPIGCILGVGLVSLPGNLNALKREVGLTVGNLLAPMWPWFWRFALLFAATGILARNWSPRGFIQIVIVAAITAAAYLGVMVRQVQESALGMYIRPRVIPLWNRFKYLTSTN